MVLKELIELITDSYIVITDKCCDIIIESTCNKKEWNNFIDKFENLKVVCISTRSVFQDYAEIIIQLDF